MPTNQYGQTEWDADPETAAELRRLAQQQKIADAMMKQGQIPLQGQMVGQTYVGASPLQGIANMLHQYNARKTSEGVEEGYKGLAESKRITQDNERNKIIEVLSGRAEQPMGPPTETGEMGVSPATSAGSRDDVLKALVASKLPAYRDAGLKSMIAGSTAKPDRVIIPAGATVREAGKPDFTAPNKPSYENATPLSKLIAERDEISKANPNDPAIKTYNNAIRKESEIAKQIVPPAQKAEVEKKISNVDARSIDKSLEKSTGANGALQLLDQADELYGKYESSRAEPILGGLARVGAAIGLADPNKAKDYELADQIAKDLGVIKLGLIGGSDTERELKVAIDTSPSPDKTVGTNREIIKNQRKAIEILQSEPDFKTEWVNKHGSLSAMDKKTGDTYGKAWRKFQKEKWGSGKPGAAGADKPDIGKSIVREVQLKDGRIGVEYSDGTRGYK